MLSRRNVTDTIKLSAIEKFEQAYAAQMAREYDTAIDLYKESIELCPTAEAYTFLGWAYSFLGDYDIAIAECLAAISLDPDFGNPYNDIGSYLIAKGNIFDCERWFKLAIAAPRYEARAYPHFNLGSIYEERGKLLKAARHYGLAISEQPDYKAAYTALRKIQERLN